MTLSAGEGFFPGIDDGRSVTTPGASQDETVLADEGTENW